MIVHGAIVAGLISPGTAGAPDIVLVELAGAGQPAALSEALTAGPDTVDGVAADAPELGAAAKSPPAPVVDDRLAALVAERDELARRIEVGSEARARLDEKVTALVADNRALESALSEERRRAARLEQSLTERHADTATAIRELEQTHDALVAALRDAITEKDVALRRAREGLTVSIVDRVLFPSGETQLTPEGRNVIDKVARVLTTTAASRIVIEGHTDNVPIGAQLRTRFPSNWELSTARAAEVVRRLVEQGMPPGVLEAVGRADTQPVASNDTEEGRRHNRRIAIVVRGAAPSTSARPEPGA